MDKIFVVEQGCYSDYRVVGVFTTRENAERIAKMINEPDEDGYESMDEAEVNEWSLNPAIFELNEGLRIFNITMSMDGTTERVNAADMSGYYMVTSARLRVWQRTKADAWKGKPIEDAVHGAVWAHDEKHAVKITNEFRAQAIERGDMARRK